MKRANALCFDEGGFLPEETYQVLEPYTTQNSDFKMGKKVDLETSPRKFPNQLLYASSASSIDTYFYKKYRDFSKRMIYGDPNYFVADINCDVVIHATKGGKVYKASLLSQNKIDTAMRENKEKALREYKNIFTTEGGDGQIIKRAQVIRNSESRPPILANSETGCKYIIAYDPARSYDNSVVVIGEVYEDTQVGYKMRIANAVTFADLDKKKKTPMRTPDQVAYLKKLILRYNGLGAVPYENIQKILIDAGSGGAGVNISDYLVEDWKDGLGNIYPGLIDKEYSKEDAWKFPNAIDKLELVSPNKFKNELYESLIEAINLDLISFTQDYSYNGYISVPKPDDPCDTQIYKLSPDEELALSQIDKMKEEMYSMYRYKSSTGKDRFDLAPEKASKMHDDLSYCCALLAFELMRMRRKKILNKERAKQDMSKAFHIRQPKKVTRF